jgi:hypothetical protein
MCCCSSTLPSCDERAVLGEGLQTQGAQALGQARIDQRRLAVGQADAGLVVQQRRDPLEVGAREGELAIDEGLAAVRE